MRPVLDAFLEAACVITGAVLPAEELDTPIEDVGIDSIALLEIAMILEDEYGVEIELEDFRELPTLRSAVASFEATIGPTP